MHFEPIGVIRTPFKKLEHMPIQPKGAKSVIATLEIDEEYTLGLKDLEGFSHIYLIYYFHEAVRTELEVIPFMDTQERGVFATRSPLRPSHLGLSITQVISIDDNIVTIKGIDILDGTPLIDIKPYIPQFDGVKGVKTGWMDKSKSEINSARSDDRFL
jgi:tRNA-Thr(GGU) m(6)t(6)A37 methyltransferase TsaA